MAKIKKFSEKGREIPGIVLSIFVVTGDAVANRDGSGDRFFRETNRPLSVPHSYSSEIPEGCMSLERFGELFHQKLDACYARLQGDSKQ